MFFMILKIISKYSLFQKMNIIQKIIFSQCNLKIISIHQLNIKLNNLDDFLKKILFNS